MPDWVTHLSLSFLASKPAKLTDYRFFLLGAVMPDIAKISEIALVILIGNRYIYFSPFIEPFHTPFICLLLCLSVAFLTEKPKFVFFTTFFAVLLHFFLDSFQSHIGYFNLLLYPFSFKNFTLSVAQWSQVKYFLLPLVIVFYWIFKAHKRIIRFKISILSFLFLFSAISAIFLTKDIFVRDNIFALGFLNNPKSWEGKAIEINKARVISINPAIVQLGNLKLALVTKEKIKNRIWIGIKGYYKDNKLYGIEIRTYKGYLKNYISLAGALFLCLIWLKK